MLLRDSRGIRFAVSQKPYDFRASLGGDHMQKDTEGFLNELQVHARAVYFMNQTHSDHVALIDGEDLGDDYFGYRIIADTDAMITNQKHIALVSRISDCTPVLLYDPSKEAMACIHAGWRSTVKKLPAKALSAMAKHYGTDPEDVLAFIGPCIGPESFQVGKEVSALWREAFSFAENVIRPDDEAHDFIDMKRTNALMLEEAGVLAENITVDPADTYTDPRYHSYRLSAPEYGSNALFAILL